MRKKAFTLMEVLVAIFILGGALLTISRIQLLSVKRIRKWKEEIERIYILKDKAFNIEFKPKLGVPIKDTVLEKPNVRISTDIKEISKKSSLNEFKKHIQIMNVKGRWDDQSLNLITFVFAQEKKS